MIFGQARIRGRRQRRHHKFKDYQSLRVQGADELLFEPSSREEGFFDYDESCDFNTKTLFNISDDQISQVSSVDKVYFLAIETRRPIG